MKAPSRVPADGSTSGAAGPMSGPPAKAGMARPAAPPGDLDEVAAAVRAAPWSAALGGAPFERLCDACLGRFLTQAARGHANRERGAAAREALGLPAGSAASACALCEGITDRVEDLVAVALAETEGWEHATFLFGTALRRTDKEREEATLAAARAALAAAGAAPEAVEAAVGAYEPLKVEMNREVGRRFGERTGRGVDFARPDVTILLDPVFGSCRLEVASLLVYGRYRKLVRGIPQTRWPCRVCWGKGCKRCGGTGKMYAESVEELVAAPFLPATGAREHAFHGMGREDIDALMVGTGRPFVLELKAPRRRSLDLAALEAEVNRLQAGRVEVEGLRWSTRDEVAAIKEAGTAKTYRAEVRAEGPVASETLIKGTFLLRQTPIAQRTPLRVSHRRADLVRERRVLSIEVEEHDRDRFRLLIEAESGTYIKELVSGDGGRTRPSLAEATGVPMKVEALDVIGVQERAKAVGDDGEDE